MSSVFEEIERSDVWKYREVFEILKTNNGKITKKKSTDKFIRKNNIKKLDFKKYTIEPVYVHELFDEDSDYIEVEIFNQMG